MKPLQNGTNKPFTITIASTKGGSAKSTNAANIGAFCAEHGLRTLLIDTDTQPTLSSYYELEYQAPGGTYEFLYFKDVGPTHIISRTTIPNLDLIQSNDPSNKISLMLRDSPDGALRFSLLLQKIEGYDIIIIDTRGTRDITVDMSVLAADVLFCPILPHILSAKEFIRGTIGMYQDLETFTAFGFTLSPLKAMIKCNAQAFQGGLFLSYETLSKMLSDRPYADAKLSEKVITQTLYLLRLTRWLTLCETVRDERGYVQGNVYILHDEPVPILDAIQLNNDYLSFLDKCTKHKDSLINSVANHIVESLMTDKTKWHYVSHLDCLQSRYQAHQHQQLEKDKPLSKTEQALIKIQQNILISTMEVRGENAD